MPSFTIPTKVTQVREWLAYCVGVLVYSPLVVGSASDAVQIRKDSAKIFLDSVDDVDEVYARYSEKTKVLVLGRES